MGKQLDRDVLIDHLRRMMEARQIDRLPKSGYAKAIQDIDGCPVADTTADREKMIRALENCTALPKCRDCPWEECEDPDCRKSEYPDDLIRQTLELLKGDANSGKAD